MARNLIRVLLAIVFGSGFVWCVDFVGPKDLNVEVQVKISEGLIQGKKAFTNGVSYYAFQGIPYAKPPLGYLRFRAPKPIDKWTGVLNATREGPSCIEVIIDLPKIETPGDEDCLYLNVFTPTNPQKMSNLPVMVWFYGGAFIQGHSKQEVLGPEALLNEGVIVVTFNYRIGFFGFLSTETLDAPGNYGLKDQNLVLRWVQRNIRNFGGDPKNVTVFGQSAGAASIIYHLQAPKSRGLFQKAIAESGSSLCTFALRLNPLEMAYELADSMFITSKDPKEVLKQLRKADVAKIKSAQVTLVFLHIINFRKYGLPFSPTLEPNHQDAFITDYQYEALEQGNFTKVPVLMGMNNQESLQFKSVLQLVKSFFGIMFDVSPSILAMPNLNTKNQLEDRKFGLEMIDHYFEHNSITDASFEEFFTMFSDDTFLRPIQKTVQMLSKFVPVYYYILKYEGEFIHTNLVRFTRRGNADKGVAHSDELKYLWKSEPPLKRKTDILLSKRLVKMWTNFAKYGEQNYRNPTPYPEEILGNVIWSPVDQSGNLTHLDINFDLKMSNSFRNDHVDFWEYMYGKYGRRPYKTY